MPNNQIEQLILPQEVWLRCFLWLDGNSLRRTALISTYFREAIREDEALGMRCFATFPPSTWKDRFSLDTAHCIHQGALKRVIQLYDRNYGCSLAAKEWVVSNGEKTEEIQEKVEAALPKLREGCKEEQSHRNLVRCFGAFLDTPDDADILPGSEKKLYLVMEHLTHGTVEDLVNSRGPLREDQIRVFLRDCLEALVFLEEERSHCYNKIHLSNMMLTSDGDTNTYRVKLVNEFSIPEIDRIMGVADAMILPYLRPEALAEQIDSEEPEHLFRGPIWSLAMCVCRMATGKMPWNGVLPGGNYQLQMLFTIHAKDPPIPQHLSCELREILSQKMLQKSPSARSTAKELLSLPYFSVEETVLHDVETTEEYYLRVAEWKKTDGPPRKKYNF